MYCIGSRKRLVTLSQAQFPLPLSAFSLPMQSVTPNLNMSKSNKASLPEDENVCEGGGEH